MPAAIPLAAAGVAAAGSIAGGLLGGGDSPDTSSQEYLAQIQGQIALEQWNRYKQKFAPFENKLMKEVGAPVEKQPGFLGAMGSLERGYGDTAASLRRTMAGRYPSGAGMEGLTQQSLALNKPRAKGEIYNQFSQSRLGNMMGVANLGRGLPASAQSGIGSAAGIYGNIANLQNMGNQNAASAWGSTGNTLGNLMQMYLMMQGMQQPTPTSTAPSWSWSGYGGRPQNPNF